MTTVEKFNVMIFLNINTVMTLLTQTTERSPTVSISVVHFEYTSRQN